MKILIIKIGAIGDVVMTLPLLTHIRMHHPNSHITWICGAQVEPLLKTTHLIDQILPINEKSLFKGSFFTRFWTLCKLWASLIQQKFDLSLTFHSDPRYRWITVPIGCKEKRFWTKKKRNPIPAPGKYHADEVLRLFTKKESSREIPPQFPELKIKSLPRFSEKPTVILAPGGAKNILADDELRRWPITSYAELMKSLTKFPVHLIVTGAESDRWICKYLEEIPHTNLVGKLDLLDLIALLKTNELLITHDSGPLHLAKLAKCPTIGLFGPTNPFEKISPHEKIKVLWGGATLSCRPCYNGKTYAPCKKNLCLTNLSPQTVLKETLNLLNLTI